MERELETNSGAAAPKISVVVPVYNEEESLYLLAQAVLGVMKRLVATYEIIFVDDGSCDATPEILRRLAALSNAVRFLRFARNCGQTAAMDAGFRAARGEIVVTLDADLQNDPSDIPRLLEKIGEFDVVIGWRRHRRDPWIRKISSRIANGVRNWGTGESVKDVGCSLKAYRRDFLDRVKLFDGMHRFLPSLLAMEGARILEVEVSHHPRRYGKSKYGIRNRAFRALWDLAAVRWMKRRSLDYRIIEEG
ncbi:MAG: glycosyltransferase family 2 protein [Vicinamibacteria bacterium]